MEEIPSPISDAEDSLDLAGELRLHEFQSRIFRNIRMLRVWVPPGYSAPKISRGITLCSI